MKVIKIIFLICIAVSMAKASNAQGGRGDRPPLMADLIVGIHPREDIVIEYGDSVRTKYDILQVYKANIKDLKSIYLKHLKLRPGFSGKITFKFTISAKGNISSIEIVKSTTNNDKFDNVVKDQIATWKWEPVEKVSVTVTTPIYFSE